MQIPVILNEQAGILAAGDRESAFAPDRLRATLAEAGLSPDIRICPGDTLEEELRKLVRSGCDTVVVGGGDGTLSCAAGVLAGTDVALGVLPLGTLNHFAKDLGIPAELDACADLIAAGDSRLVDVAEVNGRVFINNCSIGAYPAAVRRRDALRRLHGVGKWRAMLFASFDVLRELRRLRVQIKTDGELLQRRTPFVLVSNNRYSGQVLSRQLRPRLDEGRLCTYTTRVHRMAPLLRLVWEAMTAGIEAADGLEAHLARKVTVTLGERVPVIATDGELLNVQSPLEFRSRPGALRVIAPPPGESP